MAQWKYVMFWTIVDQVWMHLNKWNMEDALQPLYRETTSRDILLKLYWRMIGFWVQTGCHGRFSLGAIKDIQLELWDPLRALISWPWWNFIVLVGFFMWQIKSLWILFLRMVWKGTIVIPCISCMTMMVLKGPGTKPPRHCDSHFCASWKPLHAHLALNFLNWPSLSVLIVRTQRPVTKCSIFCFRLSRNFIAVKSRKLRNSSSLACLIWFAYFCRTWGVITDSAFGVFFPFFARYWQNCRKPVIS